MVLGIIPNLSDGGNLDFGSISGYPKFCSSWKTPQELCHVLGNCFEFHLISLLFPFIPSLSKESAWIPTPAPWEIPTWIKNVFYLFFWGYFRGEWNHLGESKQLEVAFCGVQRLDFSSLDDSLIPHILCKNPEKNQINSFNFYLTWKRPFKVIWSHQNLF